MANNDKFDNGVELKQMSSIEDLFLAHRTFHLGATVTVTDEHDREYELTILGITHEDGSGRSLIVTGYAKFKRGRKIKVTHGLGSKDFEAYFNYKGGPRKGFIKLAKDIPLVQRATAHLSRPEDEVISL